ncbi:hypothetical protein DPMN_028140 [Dreissena polymorpha]|uniref:Uncharacterized protein n=1 Tax=Dreissena polymorpha TaxID=45954 RepID=A0A9D4LW50_DREPO|nr:hypothetical protein DPMN_028140 [Dreissena polymorpha]
MSVYLITIEGHCDNVSDLSGATRFIAITKQAVFLLDKYAASTYDFVLASTKM